MLVGRAPAYGASVYSSSRGVGFATVAEVVLWCCAVTVSDSCD